MDLAFMWAESNPLMLEKDYPYTSGTTGKDGKCTYRKSEGKSKVRNYTDVKSKNANQLDSALNKQPVSVAVEADKSVF